jgi:hypothetical protein
MRRRKLAAVPEEIVSRPHKRVAAVGLALQPQAEPDRY